MSHAITGFRTRYSTLALGMASYGWIVYAFDHTDQTSMAFPDYSKDPAETVSYVEYNPKTHNITQTEHFSNLLETRMSDIAYILKKMKSDAKKENMNMDLSKTVAFGHSYGAITMIEAWKLFPNDFSLCCVFDIFFMPRLKQVQETKDYAIKQNMLILTSEKFFSTGKDGFMSFPFIYDKYDNKPVHDKFFKDLCEAHKTGNDYYYTLEGINHENCSDAAIYMETAYRAAKFVQGGDKMHVFVDATLAFMAEHDKLPAMCFKKVWDVVKGHLVEE